MNFGFRVDVDEFELKANFAPAQSGLDPTKLCDWAKIIVVLRKPRRTRFSP